MNGKYVLDTNIVIALYADDSSVMEGINNAIEIYLPSIVIGELYYGAFNSGKKEENIQKIDQLIKESLILACDDTTAKHYGKIKSQLKVKGTPIPENDIWIAALAFQYSLTLISRDTHFSFIDGLKTQRW